MNWLERVLLKAAIRRFLEGETMAAIIAWFAGKKVHLTALFTILTSLLSLFQVSIPGMPVVDHSTAIQLILTAIMAIFGRQAIAKVEVATGVKGL